VRYVSQWQDVSIENVLNVKKVTIDVNKRVYHENDNKQTLAHIDYKR